ncbi:MAG: WG repeat-containing protein [Clostridiales bacterium]|nr:WG repeat-containing protein [Clostridiales bacterium]
MKHLRTVTAFITALILLLLAGCVGNVDDPAKKTSKTDKGDGSLYFELDKLPKLEPYNNKAVKRVNNEYTDKLKPGKNYGTLVPYVGKYKKYSSNEASYSSETALYGLATEDGRIVVDPVYAYVGKIEFKDGSYVLRLPYYGTNEEEYGEDFTVAAADGSWALDFNGDSYCTVGDDMIVVEEYDADEAKMSYYDKNGKLISSFSKPQPISMSIVSEGLVLCSVYSEGKEEAYFTDIYGKTVLSGYTWANSFYGGFARACKKGGKEGLIDKKGNWVFEPVYESVTVAEKGYIGLMDREKVYVYDFDINLLATIPINYDNGTSFSFPGGYDGDGEYLCTNDSGETLYYSLPGGKKIVSKETGKPASDIYFGPTKEQMLFSAEDEDGRTYIVFDENGETVLKIKDLTGLDRISENVVCADTYYDPDNDYETDDNVRTTFLYNVKTGKTILKYKNESKGKDTYINSLLYDEPSNRFAQINFYDYATDEMNGERTCLLYDTVSEKFMPDDRELAYVNAFDTGEKVYINILRGGVSYLCDGEFKEIMRLHYTETD